MKAYSFRHPGFSDQVAQVPCPELSDLTDRDLRRLVCDLRHRIMTRDTFDTIERLFWSPAVSQAVWFTLWRSALEECHARAAREHVRLRFIFTGFCGARRGPGDVELERRLTGKGLGAWLRQTMQQAPPKRWHVEGGAQS